MEQAEAAAVSFLCSTQSLMTQLRRVQDAIERDLAPRFNVFDYIRREVSWSAIIGDLLDPAGAHGQGAAFLNEFVALCGMEPIDQATKVAIITEKAIDSGEYGERRLDILIELDTQPFIAIELKLGAGDQPDQLPAYATYLAASALADWRLVYLGPDNRKLPNAAKGMEHQDKLLIMRFVQAGYKECSLYTWLEHCLSRCRAERVRWFLLQLCYASEAESARQRGKNARQLYTSLT